MRGKRTSKFNGSRPHVLRLSLGNLPANSKDVGNDKTFQSACAAGFPFCRRSQVQAADWKVCATASRAGGTPAARLTANNVRIAKAASADLAVLAVQAVQAVQADAAPYRP